MLRRMVTTFIVCLMCRAKLSYSKEDPSQFNNHLRYHHGAYFNHHLILALNLLNETYFQSLYEEFLSGANQSDLIGAESDEAVEDNDGPQQAKTKFSMQMTECGTCNEKFSSSLELVEHRAEHDFDEQEEDDERERQEERERNKKRKQKVRDDNVDFSPRKKKNKLDVLPDNALCLTERKSPNKSKEVLVKSQDKSRYLMFSCDQCNFSFDKNIKLKKHKQKHAEENINTEEAISGEEPTGKTDEGKVINKPKSLKCDLCDYTADKNIKLKKHKLKHKVEKILETKLSPVDKSPDKSTAGSAISLLLESSPSNSPDVMEHLSLENCLPSDAKSHKEIRESSDYFHQYPKQLRSGSESDKAKFKNVAQNFPPGWFFRISGKRSCDREFFAPDFTIFRSKKAAIEYLKCMECYTEKDIERVEFS